MTKKTIKCDPVLVRTDFEIDKSVVDALREAGDDGNRELELSFSSEAPVERWFGNEILDHKRGSVRLDRLKAGGALLVGHDHRDQIGVVEQVKIDAADRKGRATVRFGKGARAEEIFQDVLDGIRRFVSVGYRIHKMVLDKKEGDTETYRATDWEPFEISLVSVPADMSVGVGRNDGAESVTIEIDMGDTDVEHETTDTREAEGTTQAPAKTDPPSVDVNAIRKAELDRIRDIEASAKALGLEDMGAQYISEGRSIDEWNAKVVAELRGGKYHTAPSGKDADIGITEKETRKYSLLNVINMLANPGDKRFAEMAAFEMDCSRAVAQALGKEPQGIFVPNEALRHDMQRDQNVGTDTAGGHLVATELLSGSFIDALRNALVLAQAGMTVLPGLQGNIAIPKKTANSTAYWVTEGNAITESQMTFGQVAMTPKTVGAFTDYTRKFMLQSSIGAEQLVRNDLAGTLAAEIDRAGINGSGTGAEPTGIISTAGIGSVAGGTNGLAPTWDHIVDLESAPANNNVIGQLPAYVTNTKVRGKLKRTEKFASTGDRVWEGGAQPLNGYDAFVSNAVPSNLDKGTSTGVCSAILYGHWADLVLGLWGALDILVDPYTGSSAGTVRVVALQDVDYAVRRAESFAAMLDALTV